MLGSLRVLNAFKTQTSERGTADSVTLSGSHHPSTCKLEMTKFPFLLLRTGVKVNERRCAAEPWRPWNSDSPGKRNPKKQPQGAPHQESCSSERVKLGQNPEASGLLVRGTHSLPCCLPLAPEPQKWSPGPTLPPPQLQMPLSTPPKPHQFPRGPSWSLLSPPTTISPFHL